MKFLIVILMALQALSAQAANTPETFRNRCLPEQKSEPLYSDDFRWGYSLAELVSKFTEIYSSPKRLPKKAYWDEKTQSLKLPYEPGRGGDVTITEKFVQAVTDHIEKAFSMNVIDGVFFPDMGHSHILIPESIYDSKYRDIPVDEMSRMYEGFYSDSKVKFLYHTAEQLTMTEKTGEVLNDPRLAFRHKTRNLVGGNFVNSNLEFFQNPQSKVNTVHEVNGYYWWGGGFNLSANKDGCFSYQNNNQIYYYDISQYDLESSPGRETWGTTRSF